MTTAGQRAAQRIADYDRANGIRRRTYCRHWSMVQLQCRLHGECPNAAECADYEDAVEARLRELRQAGRYLDARLLEARMRPL